MILVAGPWVGEFGYELFQWQGYIRAVSRNFNKTVIACRPGHEILYADFCKDFIIHSAPVGPCICRSNVDASMSYVTGDVFNNIPYASCIPGTERFASDAAQEFIPYGNCSGEENRYDIIVHARNIVMPPTAIRYTGSMALEASMQKSSRNWGVDKWVQLIKMLPGAKIACIGIKDTASHLPGTTDLRNINLSRLVDVLRTSGLIVGPSSGPMHLAALCGCQQVVWGTDNLIPRYTKDWNPFGTAVHFLAVDKDWDPDPRDVYATLTSVIS